MKTELTHRQLILRERKELLRKTRIDALVLMFTMLTDAQQIKHLQYLTKQLS